MAVLAWKKGVSDAIFISMKMKSLGDITAILSMLGHDIYSLPLSRCCISLWVVSFFIILCLSCCRLHV